MVGAELKLVRLFALTLSCSQPVKSIDLKTGLKKDQVLLWDGLPLYGIIKLSVYGIIKLSD